MMTDTTTLTGIICPVYDGNFDNITGVTLSATDDKDYELKSEKYLNELVNLCREAVRVRGRLQHKGRRKVLEVYEYEVVPRYDDFHDPDDVKRFDDAD